MAKRGQTWEPTPEEVAEIERMASLGMSQEQIATCKGISWQTLIAHRARNKEFNKAYKRGRVGGLERATTALWKKIDEGNLAAICFYLKTQWHWRETSTVENKLEVSGSLQLQAVKSMTDQEIQQLAEIVAAKGLPDAKVSDTD